MFEAAAAAAPSLDILALVMQYWYVIAGVVGFVLYKKGYIFQSDSKPAPTDPPKSLLEQFREFLANHKDQGDEIKKLFDEIFNKKPEVK